MQYDDISGGEFVEIQESTDRATGAVHEGGGLDEEIFLLADGANGELSMEAGLAMEVFKIKMLAKEIKREKAGVVPGGFVLFSGIAETDDESHNQCCYFFCSAVSEDQYSLQIGLFIRSGHGFEL